MTDRKETIKCVIDTSLVAKMTVREVERIDYQVTKAGGSKNAGIDQKVAIAAMYMWTHIRKYRYTDQGEKITIEKLLEVAQDTRVRFIQQHIINYAAYEITRDFYEWLVDKKYINKAAEGFWRKIERSFVEYQKAQSRFTELTTWRMFLDHMRLTTNTLRPYVAMLETTIRDYIIQHRNDILEAAQKDDIPLLQKAAVCFVLLTSMQHSYRDYFMDIVKTHGVDFSIEFRYADLGKMIRNTVWMCEKLGMRFGVDKDGDTVLLGVNINNSVRVKSTWNTIVNILGNNELLDRTAEQAMNLYPEERKKFDEELAKVMEEREEQKRKEMEEGFELLMDKYNTRKAG